MGQSEISEYSDENNCSAFYSSIFSTNNVDKFIRFFEFEIYQVDISADDEPLEPLTLLNINDITKAKSAFATIFTKKLYKIIFPMNK